MRQVVLVAHDIRSAHNIGSLMRTAEGLGLTEMFITGLSPYPAADKDKRLPHIAARVSAKIIKTSLGAEKHLKWSYSLDVGAVIKRLKANGYKVVALEQSPGSVDINDYKPSDKTALIAGSETVGISADVLKLCDSVLEIPMYGKKESFNVAVAAGMALFYLTTA